MGGTPGASSCWCYWFCVLRRLEVELDVDDCCEENVYSTVIALLIDVCNKNLLEFDEGVLTVVWYYFVGIPSITQVMYHFKTKVRIIELGRWTLATCPYISVFSKTDATSPLTLSPRSIQKRGFSAIKICLEYAKLFCVPGVWPYYVAVVISEAPVSTLLPPLGAMFASANNYLFILFSNVPGVWPYYSVIVLAEAPVSTLIPPLGDVTLFFDGLFSLDPPFCCMFVIFAPAEDSLFILFSNVPGVWPSSTYIVLYWSTIINIEYIGCWWVIFIIPPPLLYDFNIYTCW